MKPILAAVILLSCAPVLYAGADLSKSITTPVVEVTPFDSGRHEIDVAGGYFHSPVIAKGNRPTYNWAQGNLNFGWMLYSPSAPWGANWLRGNWEFLVNAFGAGVTEGPGSYMAGGRLLFRYNFVQPDAKWVPFFQLGGGGLADDAYNDQAQHVIGSGFEFSLVADLGLRYFIAPDWALLAMGDFEHISNAGTAARNQGANAFGFNAGVGFFFSEERAARRPLLRQTRDGARGLLI